MFNLKAQRVALVEKQLYRLELPLRKYTKKIGEDEEIAKSIQSGIKANETIDAED